MGQTNPTKREYAREWELAQQATSNCNKTFAEAIKKIEKEQRGLTGQEITSWLSCSPNFIGCFAENELQNLRDNFDSVI